MGKLVLMLVRLRVSPGASCQRGGRVYAFDISGVAIDKANEMAAYNGVTINTDVMNFHSLKYRTIFLTLYMAP